VQYKGQASEMFKELLSDIRAGVIGRMFLFHPRRPGGQSSGSSSPVSAPVPAPAVQPSQAVQSEKKKRKRH